MSRRRTFGTTTTGGRPRPRPEGRASSYARWDSSDAEGSERLHPHRDGTFGSADPRFESRLFATSASVPAALEILCRGQRSHPDSLNPFFRGADYEGLKGNPVFGYWNEGHFRWKGTHVAWDGITSATESAAPITRRAWSAAFAYVAKKHGLVLDREAAIRVRGACIAAVLDPSLGEPNRGVVLEVRIDSPTGPFRYRFGMGKPTIEDAVGASLDWAGELRPHSQPGSWLPASRHPHEGRVRFKPHPEGESA